MEIFKQLTVPQLQEIRKIIKDGIVATAESKVIEPIEEAAEKSYLCHKSPPAGYPKDKSQYGDPACYRYPLNTKARCLAAWRYVNQVDNAKILGGKAGSVKSKIKSYAKKNYNLDLESGDEKKEESTIDWAKIFAEYYDSETMGERCDDIILEPEVQEVKKLEDEKDKVTEQAAQACDPKIQELETQFKDATDKLTEANKELIVLREFKQKVDADAARAELLKNRKLIVEKANLKIDLEAEAKWLEMSDDVFTFAINQMSEIRILSVASTVKVPDIHAAPEKSARDIVREGFNERKRR
jgi:hypothetical protein